jgi:hypothetical protein
MKTMKESRSRRPSSLLVVSAVLAAGAAFWAFAATTVPTDIQQPGTQPGGAPTITSPTNCDNCHDDTGGTQDRQLYPGYAWRGGMMANAGRDPIFWATLAIAEQDFLPGSNPTTRGGVGDLCIRCHSVGGWLAGRSTPTDGSGLSASSDTDGVECDFCHMLVNPDQPVNISGTTEAYVSPFEAYDAVTGEPHFGSGQYVLNGNGTRLGPYTNAQARHTFIASPFHRQGQLCGTCHDVSNSAVGDLAHNNGSALPLAPGSFSGVPGSPIAGKAAFNNVPYKYGIVERTFSEWTASSLDTLLVNSFNTLPTDLKAAGGSLAIAYNKAFGARSNANYEDGAARTFTCQTCHMPATTGLGCNKAGVPVRTDLPMHDQTGAGHWMPDAVIWQNDQGTLRFGTGITATQRAALLAGQTRAIAMIKSAASISAVQSGTNLSVKVTNLTGHKLISGYPEGRRMWLNVKWKDAGGAVVAENGAYGPIGRSVTDRAGVSRPVQSILDPAGTKVYEAKPGLTREWAAQLINLGYPAGMPLSFDRITDAVELTLGQLAAAAPGSAHHSFHFVLNNVVMEDNRIPPYGFSYDEARMRNALPVPAAQYGAPGPGGTYRYWDEVPFPIPAGAVAAEVRLYYQQTSWEYVQFLWKGNDGLNAFLANEGVNLLDAWANKGMAAPVEIAAATAPILALAGAVSQLRFTSKTAMTWNAAAGATRYDMLRGSLAALRANRSVGDASCLREDLAPAGTTDGSVPAAGGGYYYIVRGDGPGVPAGTYDNPPGAASPFEGRDAEVGTAGGTGCTDLP